ncbi:carbonic anhydrase [Candidatus Endobugula sertula]|uniref:Carbonic anhydrase n=1 Tax=Candidatus Endobugula sertula TaxID=62101 RepID=A0A1D2QLX7_9GAMM|nr:carbonic anhydrase [Candidatus Endobugula sertula]
MKELQYLFKKNIAWANGIKEKTPDFFNMLSKQQTPELLWIGCSDSRVHANDILDLPPGEVFVHRNIANVVRIDDLNCMSVVQFAVEVLKVKHIVVCGHYGCGGIKAVIDNQRFGLIDAWLGHIQEVYQLHKNQLDGLSDDDKQNRLCELNVLEQVKNVSRSSFVREAWAQGRELSIHSWIYSIQDGLLKDLGLCITSEAQ